MIDSILDYFSPKGDPFAKMVIRRIEEKNRRKKMATEGTSEKSGFREYHTDKVKVSVYIDTGVVFDYFVDSPEKAREHASEIVKTGYRHTPQNSDDLEWYPPHRIKKVKVEGGGESSNYKDVVARAT